MWFVFKILPLRTLDAFIRALLPETNPATQKTINEFDKQFLQNNFILDV